LRKLIVAAFVVACSPSGPRDVAGEQKDVRVQAGAVDAGPSNEAYAYVARRPHGVVALAEARQMTDEESHAIIEKLANDLESCAARLEAEHTLVEGAARIVALAQPSGPPAMNVKLAPGGDVAQNALMCLVAPIRALPFTKGGLAIEYTWGPAARERGAPQVDASAPL
jgi:hypothetical protein